MRGDSLRKEHNGGKQIHKRKGKVRTNMINVKMAKVVFCRIAGPFHCCGVTKFQFSLLCAKVAGAAPVFTIFRTGTEVRSIV